MKTDIESQAVLRVRDVFPISSFLSTLFLFSKHKIVEMNGARNRNTEVGANS